MRLRAPEPGARRNLEGGRQFELLSLEQPQLIRGGARTPPRLVVCGSTLGAHGIPIDTPAARAEFQLRMEARRAEEQDEQTLQAIRQSWSFGSEQFKIELLQRLEGELGEHHSGSLHQQTSTSRAERIIAEELTRLHWTESDLAAQRKNAPEKLAIAARLPQRDHPDDQADCGSRAPWHIQRSQREPTSFYAPGSPSTIPTCRCAADRRNIECKQLNQSMG